MEASVLDLRRRMREVLKALDRKEEVVLRYRGKAKGTIIPVGAKKKTSVSVRELPAFGMWKDRKDLADVEKAVRRMRKGRYAI